MPHWRRRAEDGRQELLYRTDTTPGDLWMGVWVGAEGASEPQVILDLTAEKISLGGLPAALPDGRFLGFMSDEVAEEEPEEAIHVVVNWTAEIEPKLSSGK